MTARLTAAELPPHMVNMMRPQDRKALKLRTNDEAAQIAEASTEKIIQRDCERFLTLHGYRPRTQDGIAAKGEIRGWFVHLHKSKRNPYLLDLLILRLDGRYIEVELKAANGRPTDEQAGILRAGGPVHLIWSVEAFIELITQWENEEGK